jgi:8-oxo-dGTP pyrophosphatase MutT (NUDIX family)
MEFKDWDGNKHSIPADREICWRPSVYGLIIENEEILLVKPKWHDMWELPGGGVELEESIASAMERELLEETGYKVEGDCGEPVHLEDNFFYAPNVDEYFHSLPIVFSTKLKDEEQMMENIDFEEEIESVKWFALQELGSIDLHPIASDAIKKIELKESE